MDDAFDAGDVDALGRPRVELMQKHVLDGEGAREDEQAGGLTVEAVHHENAAAAPGLQPVPQQAIDSALTLALGRDREQPHRLVDDEDGAVLVHESERGPEGGRGEVPPPARVWWAAVARSAPPHPAAAWPGPPP